MRKVAVLSDLHMGVNFSGTNGLKHSDEAFSVYLTRLVEELSYDLIVINGDCFELWEPGPEKKNFGKPMTKELFGRIVSSWPLTSEILLHSKNVVLLNGNHDACVRTKKMVENCYADLLLPDFSLYAAHGHQSDIWCSDDSLLLGVAKLATRVYGKMELIKHSMDEDVCVLENTIRSVGTGKCDVGAMSHASAVSSAVGCKIVVYGHTHNPMVLCRSDMVYCNSGNCCTNRDMLDQIDFELVEEPMEMEEEVMGEGEDEKNSVIELPEENRITRNLDFVDLSLEKQDRTDAMGVPSVENGSSDSCTNGVPFLKPNVGGGKRTVIIRQMKVNTATMDMRAMNEVRLRIN